MHTDDSKRTRLEQQLELLSKASQDATREELVEISKAMVLIATYLDS